MPLRSPSRLPRRFIRPTSRYTRSVVTRRHARQRRKLDRGALKSHAARKAARIARILREELLLWTGVLMGALVVLLIAVLLFSPAFDVKRITVRRLDARIDSEQIEQALRPLFAQRLFLVTKAEVNALLTEKFADITSVDIEKEYPSTITVTVHFDRIVAELDVRSPQGEDLASGSGALVAGSGSFAYVTTRGHAVLSQLKLAENLPTFAIVDWGIRPTHGMRILDEDFILRIFETRRAVEEDFGIEVSGITVFLRAREFHFTTPGFALWFDTASTAQQHFDRFRRFLEIVPLAEVTQYIDLRLADRVVYK